MIMAGSYSSCQQALKLVDEVLTNVKEKKERLESLDKIQTLMENERDASANVNQGTMESSSESKLTEVMQIKSVEFEHYLEKAKGEMKELENVLSKLKTKVRLYFLLYAFFRFTRLWITRNETNY